jgi:hypothetical protein
MGQLRRVPAEITVLAGDFGPFPGAQPLVFAHLWDIAPDLDLDHVEVIPARGARARLEAYFEAPVIDRLEAATGAGEAIVLILPAAFSGLEPPALPEHRLRPLGLHRGTVRHLLQTASGP